MKCDKPQNKWIYVYLKPAFKLTDRSIGEMLYSPQTASASAIETHCMS
jgi:hypothetical protein